MKRELGVDVSLGAGKFFRTKLVRFCNRIVFLNEMENAFLLIQNSLPVGIIKRNAVTVSVLYKMKEPVNLLVYIVASASMLFYKRG